MRAIFIFIFFISFYISDAEDVCFKSEGNCGDATKRYLLYDINRPEGFNLRRDVFVRLAVLAHKMKNSENTQLNSFRLVLPPWSYLVHWEYSDIPEYIPWELYFDLESLKKFAPVIEMYEFFSEQPNKYKNVEIDQVFTLQHFEDMFETGNFEERMTIEDCNRKNDFLPDFFYYNNITAKQLECLSFHGSAVKLTELFLNTSAKTILINHAEVVLHDYFGSSLYWQARRSMRFSKDLKKIAGNFREKYLNSSDDSDNTRLPDSWLDETPKRNAFGGPYLAVHLRRRDFVRSRPDESPSMKSVSKQIETVLKKLQLNTVFVATDGSKEEFETLSKLLEGYVVLKYTPTAKIKAKYKDGGVAIIDQIICSYARHFIGTHESTFSFRIQEEREILGFRVESTYNVFCSETACPEQSVWKIVY